MAYDVTIARLPLRTLFEIRGTAERVASWCGDAIPPLPHQPNRATAAGGRRLIHTGRDRWLLMAPIAEESVVAGALRPGDAPGDLSLVLVSDTLTFFSVTGPEAGEVMAVATPLDLHPQIFPADGAGWTEAFGAKALLRRTEGGFEVAVDRSYTDWFEACLVAAAS